MPALIAALKDKQLDVRVAVIDALGEIGAGGKEAAPQGTKDEKEMKFSCERNGPVSGRQFPQVNKPVGTATCCYSTFW